MPIRIDRAANINHFNDFFSINAAIVCKIAINCETITVGYFAFFLRVKSAKNVIFVVIRVASRSVSTVTPGDTENETARGAPFLRLSNKLVFRNMAKLRHFSNDA